MMILIIHINRIVMCICILTKISLKPNFNHYTISNFIIEIIVSFSIENPTLYTLLPFPHNIVKSLFSIDEIMSITPCNHVYCFLNHILHKLKAFRLNYISCRINNNYFNSNSKNDNEIYMFYEIIIRI